MPLTSDVLWSACGKHHPARTMPFDDLYTGLMERVRNGLVTVMRHEDLELFSYTIDCQFDKKWDLFSLMSRGLILCPSQKKVVATPFPKFFNYGECVLALPDLSFDVTEKVDGSLGIIFNHNGKWRVSTRGSLCSDQALWATDWLNKNANLSYLDQMIGWTLLGEIVYRENRIVIPYDFEGIVLISGYAPNGTEIVSGEETAAFAQHIGLRSVKVFHYEKLDQMLELAKSLQYNQEGFVVKFSNGFRLKIKGDEYCRVHRLISNCTPIRVWESMMACDNIDLIRKDLPEEMHKDFDSMVSIFREKFDKLIAEIRGCADATSKLSDKELGLLLKSGKHDLSNEAKDFIFLCRKQNFLEEVYKPTGLRRKAFKTFRPEKNKLEGYTPSSAMNRFSEMEDS